MITIECATPEDAHILRNALQSISGLDVEDELFAKGGTFDVRKIVSFTASTVIITAAAGAAIVAALSSLGYTDIKINGKVVVVSVLSIEGALQASKSEVKSSKAK